MRIEYALAAQEACIVKKGAAEQLLISGPGNDLITIPHLPFDARQALVIGIRYSDAEASVEYGIQWWTSGRGGEVLSQGVESYPAPGFNPYAPEGWEALTVQFALVEMPITEYGAHFIGCRLLVRGNVEPPKWIPLMVLDPGPADRRTTEDPGTNPLST